MTTFGLVAMSAKPYHVGHDGLIRLAASECDEVHLYVSTSDRARPGELPIAGADMFRLWKETIEKSLPDNVKVTYGGSPIGNVWKELGAANESGSRDDFIVYSDPVDIAQNFPERLFQKYCGDLYERGHIRLRPVERTSTVDVSGTKMRGFLSSGDKPGFMKHLPDGIDKELVWNVLNNSSITKTLAAGSSKKRPAAAAGSSKKRPAAKKTSKEALLRDYVKLLISD